jgi:hypothetical protein
MLAIMFGKYIDLVQAKEQRNRLLFLNKAKIMLPVPGVNICWLHSQLLAVYDSKVFPCNHLHLLII